MDLSKRIESIRQELKISKTEMAEKLNMDLANYARLEKQGDRLKYFQICDIASALGVSVEFLLFGERFTNFEKKKEAFNKHIKLLNDKINSLKKDKYVYWKLVIDYLSKELRNKIDEKDIANIAHSINEIFNYSTEMLLYKNEQNLKSNLDLAIDLSLSEYEEIE